MKRGICVSGLVIVFFATALATYAAKTDMVTYKAGNETLNAFLASPDKPGRHPGIVMINNLWGLNDWVKGQAERFADQGYVVMAVDLSNGDPSKGIPFKEPSQEQVLQMLKAAYSSLQSQPNVKKNKIATLGWQRGGRLSLQLAMVEPTAKAVVINYSQLPISASEPTDSKNRDWTQATPEDIASVHFPVLANYGEDDAGVKPPEVLNFQKVLQEHGKKIDIKLYPGVGQGFENESNKNYNPEATKDAYARIDSFLAKTLK